jgi:hypothetical protein
MARLKFFLWRPPKKVCPSLIYTNIGSHNRDITTEDWQAKLIYLSEELDRFPLIYTTKEAVTSHNTAQKYRV